VSNETRFLTVFLLSLREKLMLKKLIMTSSALAVAMSMNVYAHDSGDKTYLVSSNGMPVVSSNGQCVVSSGMPADQLKACGYVMPAPAPEPVVAPPPAPMPEPEPEPVMPPKPDRG
jgi:hypothetical protein